MSQPLFTVAFLLPFITALVFTLLRNVGFSISGVLLVEQLAPTGLLLYTFMAVALAGFLGALPPARYGKLQTILKHCALVTSMQALGIAGALVGWFLGVSLVAGMPESLASLQWRVRGILFLVLLATLAPYVVKLVLVSRTGVLGSGLLENHWYCKVARTFFFAIGTVATFGCFKLLMT